MFQSRITTPKIAIQRNRVLTVELKSWLPHGKRPGRKAPDALPFNINTRRGATPLPRHNQTSAPPIPRSPPRGPAESAASALLLQPAHVRQIAVEPLVLQPVADEHAAAVRDQGAVLELEF